MYRGFTHTKGGLNARGGFAARKRRPTKKQTVYQVPETKPKNNIKTAEDMTNTTNKPEGEK